MSAGAYTPFLSSYFSSIGLSAAQTGILLTVSPLAMIFVQPLWARLSDRTGKRKLVLCLLAGVSAAAALLYYAGASFAAVLVATVAFTAFFSALLPLCDALVIEGCLSSGVEFAHVRMGGTCGYAFVVFVVGVFLDAQPRAQFVLVCALLLVFLVAAALIPLTRADRVPEEPDAADVPVSAGDAPRRAQAPAALGLFDTAEIFYILAFAFVSQMGLGFLGSFLGRYVVELGYGQSLVGTLSAVSALSELPILLFAHQLVRRFGVMRLLSFSCLMMALRLVLVGMGAVPTMVCGQLLQSVTYMTVYYCCTCYVAEHVLPGRLSQGQSVFVLVQSGLAMMVANLAGGAIGDALGMRASFFLSAALVLVGTAAVMVAYRRWAAAESPGYSGSR